MGFRELWWISFEEEDEERNVPCGVGICKITKGLERSHANSTDGQCLKCDQKQASELSWI